MHKLRNAIVWSLLVVIILAGAIVFLGALNDMDGQPLIENPGALIGSMFTSLGLVATAVFTIVTKTEKTSEIIRENSQVAREQLENSHAMDPEKLSNIRDDLDTKASKEDLFAMQEYIMRALGDGLERIYDSVTSLDRRIEGSASDIRGMRKDVGTLNRKHDELDKRMDKIATATGSIKKVVKSGRA